MAPDGRFYNPFEEESGPVDSYMLKAVKPGSTLYSVRVPRAAFYRYGVVDFLWHAYRILPRSRCRTVASGARDCFQESRTRMLSYNTF